MEAYSFNITTSLLLFLCNSIELESNQHVSLKKESIPLVARQVKLFVIVQALTIRDLP